MTFAFPLAWALLDGLDGRLSGTLAAKRAAKPILDSWSSSLSPSGQAGGEAYHGTTTHLWILAAFL